jgi:HEAT repeat protein
MTTLRRNNILLLALLAVSVTVGSSQEDPSTVVHGGLQTLEDALRERRITDQSKQSLIAALQDSNWQVRGIAANKLAADGHFDAIPAIESALFTEGDLNAQANLAEALWVLHDPKGVEHLHSMCTNEKLPLSGLSAAIQMLQSIHVTSGECGVTLMAEMGRKNESLDLAMAVSTLPVIYGQVSPNQASAIFILIWVLFADRTQDPFLRLQAGRALAQIRGPEAAELLRRGISLEIDPTMREAFERDLEESEKNP